MGPYQTLAVFLVTRRPLGAAGQARVDATPSGSPTIAPNPSWSGGVFKRGAVNVRGKMSTPFGNEQTESGHERCDGDSRHQDTCHQDTVTRRKFQSPTYLGR